MIMSKKEYYSIAPWAASTFDYVWPTTKWKDQEENQLDLIQ